MSSGALWFSLVCHVEGIWAFDWNITEWSFSFPFSSFPFHQKPFSSLSAAMLCYMFSFVLSKLDNLFWLVHRWCMLASDLRTIIVIHSRSHYEMRRGSWRNLDLEKYIFRKYNLIELNWSQRLNAAAFDKRRPNHNNFWYFMFLSFIFFPLHIEVVQNHLHNLAENNRA